MSSFRKIAVKDTTAAQMLDMSARQFRDLVKAGALPPAKRVGCHERWLVSDLEAIVTGEAMRPNEGFDL